MLSMDNAHVEPVADNDAEAIKCVCNMECRPWMSVGLLTLSRAMCRADPHRRHAFLLIDGTGRRHLFCAENDAERNEWVQVLQLHIEMMEPITLSAMLGPEGRGDKPAAAAYIALGPITLQ